MSHLFEKYMLHPVERPITDADAKVELICSKDHPIMDFFYESCYYRHDYEICDTVYALPYNELFCFMSTNNDDEALDATVTMEINGQTLTVSRPCKIQIPAFVPHGHIMITDVKTPVFNYVAGFGREHVGVPEELWKTEDVIPVEEMIIYNNADTTGSPDPDVNEPQHWVIKCLANKTMKGDLSGIMRRFFETEKGWLYVRRAHTHGYPEALGFYGTDGWNPYKLNADITQYIGGHIFKIDRPTLCYFPAYVPHCPIFVNRVWKQILWHSFGRAIGPFNAAKTYDFENIIVQNGEAEMPEVW